MGIIKMLANQFFVMPEGMNWQGPAFDYGAPQFQFGHHESILGTLMHKEGEFFKDMFVFEERVLLEAADTGVDVAWGFLEGFVKRNDLAKIQTCLDDVESIEQEVKDILDDFKTLR